MKEPLNHLVRPLALRYWEKTNNKRDIYYKLISDVRYGIMKATLEYTKGNASRASIIMGISRANFLIWEREFINKGFPIRKQRFKQQKKQNETK